MSFEIKELIEKIKKEAILEAEKQKEEILNQAEKEAKRIIQEAELKSQEILNGAEIQAEKIKESLKHTLRQTERDFLITLKDQIEKLLLRIIQQEIKETLNSQALMNILEKIILNAPFKEKIIVYLSEEDLIKLKETFLKELQERLKNEISFVIDPQIKAGFKISFDREKSYFDFSQESLAEYLFKRLHPQIKEFLKE